MDTEADWEAVGPANAPSYSESHAAADGKADDADETDTNSGPNKALAAHFGRYSSTATHP